MTNQIFKNKWIIGIIAFDGIAIIALGIFLFLNFSSINLVKGIVLIVIAGIILLSVMGLMIYFLRILTPQKNPEKNTLHKS